MSKKKIKKIADKLSNFFYVITIITVFASIPYFMLLGVLSNFYEYLESWIFALIPLFIGGVSFFLAFVFKYNSIDREKIKKLREEKAKKERRLKEIEQIIAWEKRQEELKKLMICVRCKSEENVKMLGIDIFDEQAQEGKDYETSLCDNCLEEELRKYYNFQQNKLIRKRICVRCTSEENLRMFTLYILDDEAEEIQDKETYLCENCLEKVLNKYFNYQQKRFKRYIPQSVRTYVWRRDQGKCVECGSKENLEFDHIIPFSKGGTNTARNIQILCEKCNRKKKDNI